MNPYLEKLQPYPFEKLAHLKSGIEQPVEEHISLSIGEPRHPTPQLIHQALTENLDALARYPATRGIPELRRAIADWCARRFQLDADALDPASQVLPVNGSREALFSFAQAVINPLPGSLVLMPNPFYQIYEGAALLAGAIPKYLNCLADNDYLPDFDALTPEMLERCQLLYICSPGNPTGAVMDIPGLQKLVRLAHEYDFIIAADECYSELYFDEQRPPPGLLQAAWEMGERDFKNCVVFHSLSKRSNAPGLRSGFVAGDAHIIEQFFRYRTYHGCAMPIHHQLASIAAWQDESHVIANRDSYRRKFATVVEILKPVLAVERPAASFYLWIPTGRDDEDFARELFRHENITVLPGSYLSRQHDGINPGQDHVRVALVASEAECERAALGIRHFCENV